MSSKRHVVKTIQLNRLDARQDWGFDVNGSWMDGEWIRVCSVARGSPAERADLRVGDYLVKIEDELTLFMSSQQVGEAVLRNSNLEMSVQIERGWVDPMSDGYPKDSTPDVRKSGGGSNEDKVTIVIDTERGIYSQSRDKLG